MASAAAAMAVAAAAAVPVAGRSLRDLFLGVYQSQTFDCCTREVEKSRMDLIKIQTSFTFFLLFLEYIYVLKA